ncbi:hypothetical protein [Litchfieldia salsa]|uniref:Uncharacterized protein n=1 Tax=Litchfieldia salsa TaxID=930152 RepID=A0A1H0NVA9_9BACI|nr:hypothetical protein [Litchfieldia salsa]SDO96395.1 hypothetical protein SAMN05216565_10127 [Litchfieldia salsa]
MRKLNEDGNTLVMVLLTATLIMISGTALTSQALTGTKQVKQTEGQQIATDAAEMGIDHFYSEVKKGAIALDLSTNTCTQVQNAALAVPTPKVTIVSNTATPIEYTVDSTTGTSYAITVDSVPCTKVDETKYTFSFYSTGTTLENGNKISKTLTATFPIQLNNKFPEKPPGFTECYNDSSCLNVSKDKDTYTYLKDTYFPTGLELTEKVTTIAQSVYIEGDLQIKGYNNLEGELIINKDLFVNGDSEFNNFANTIVYGDYYLSGQFVGTNHAEVVVKEDAFFYDDITQKPHTFVCVEDDLTVTQKTLDSNVITLFPEGMTTCEQVESHFSKKENGGNGTEANGIFAKRVSVFNSSSNVSINDNELEIIY